METGTKCLHAGYKGENGMAHALPICQSTTFNYDSSEHIGKLFDLSESGFFYTRLANPTTDFVEQKIAALEGGIGAICTSSGQSATFLAIMTLLKAGDHIVSASTIYGGTFNLLSVTLEKMGVETTFVDPNASLEELQKAVKPNTKLVFGETIANPALSVLDIEKFAKLAHDNKVPLMVDNTFATPILCKPIEFGADIVTQSTTKYMDGHAVAVGGVIVDSGKFDYANGKFPEFTMPDESYHGLCYSKDCKQAAFLVKARVQLMRDLGVCPSPNNSFLLNLGLETLHLRMKQHCENGKKVAEYLKNHPKVEKISYPFLEGDKYNDLAKKYLKGGSGVISFVIKGGKEGAVKFIDSLKMVLNVVHVCCVKTIIINPASSTHRQLSDEQLKAAGVDPGLIRLSVGIEEYEDIIADIEQAMENV